MVDQPQQGAERLEVLPLDKICENCTGKELIVKLDVEGFEYNALLGSSVLLQSGAILALIVELNQSGQRFGHHDEDVVKLLNTYGFIPIHYDALARSIIPYDGRNNRQNTIFVRDKSLVMQRLKTSEIQVEIHTHNVFG